MIVSKFLRDSKLLGSGTGKEGDSSGKRKSLPLKWESFPGMSARSANEECLDNWEEPSTFIAALEKVEAWIFVRIIESIWWQVIFSTHSLEGLF